VREVLSEGSHFGTKSLVYNTPMKWSVVAVTHVDVFSVSQRDFESVLCDHPNSRDSIASLAQEQYGQAMLIASD
jgi:CRP-like cAMP-binding protein